MYMYYDTIQLFTYIQHVHERHFQILTCALRKPVLKNLSWFIQCMLQSKLNLQQVYYTNGSRFTTQYTSGNAGSDRESCGHYYSPLMDPDMLMASSVDCIYTQEPLPECNEPHTGMPDNHTPAHHMLHTCCTHTASCIISKEQREAETPACLH